MAATRARTPASAGLAVACSRALGTAFGARARIRCRLQVLSKLASPFCVNLHYAYHDADLISLVLTLCPGGDLAFLLKSQSAASTRTVAVWQPNHSGEPPLDGKYFYGSRARRQTRWTEPQSRRAAPAGSDTTRRL
jgi:hypothetical protein